MKYKNYIKRHVKTSNHHSDRIESISIENHQIKCYIDFSIVCLTMVSALNAI